MWYTTESNIEPIEIDTTSSQVYNYVRKNITSTTKEDVTLYTYEEIKIPKEQWYLYQQNLQLQAENENLNDMLLSIVDVIDSL